MNIEIIEEVVEKMKESSLMRFNMGQYEVSTAVNHWAAQLQAAINYAKNEEQKEKLIPSPKKD